jgi:hypothetical protein
MLSLSALRVGLRTSGLLAVAVALCACNAVGPKAGQEDTGPVVSELADLAPTNPPAAKSVLILGGTRVPVDLTTRLDGKRFSIALHAHDEIFEEEVYESNPDSFAVRVAGGETYQPAIPLLVAPIRLGASQQWTGTSTSGSATRKATATITSSTDKLYDEPDSPSAVRVSVKLMLDANGDAPPAPRELSFWFVPNEGIVRREFGNASIREPAER